MARRRKHVYGFAIATLTVGVLVGTFFVINAPEPEVVRATSTDGRVRVEARMRGGAVAVARRDDIVGPFTSVLSPVYEIAFTSSAPETAAFTFAYDDAWLESAGSLSLLAFDRTRSAWQPQPFVFDPTARTLTAELPASGSALLSVGRRLTFSDIPNASDAVLLDELVSFPPPDAVGYRAFIAMSTVVGDFVIVSDRLGQGGCGGAFRSSVEHTLTSKDVTVDGVTYRIGVIWELGNGCTVGERIEHLLY